MERKIQKNGLINLLALVGVGIAAGFAVAAPGAPLAGQIGMRLFGIGMLVAAASWFQMRLEEREQLEKLELEELAKSAASSALFENRRDGIFPARRSREQFERFFIPSFSVILLILESAGGFALWHWVSTSGALVVPGEALLAASIFALLALVLFLFGTFSATIARLENHRLLRPRPVTYC